MSGLDIGLAIMDLRLVDKNGDLKKYSFGKTKNKRWEFWDIPDPSINRWSVSKDSILSIMG